MKGVLYGITGGDGGYLVDLRGPDCGHDLVPPIAATEPTARDAERLACAAAEDLLAGLRVQNMLWWALHGGAGRVGVNR